MATGGRGGTGFADLTWMIQVFRCLPIPDKNSGSTRHLNALTDVLRTALVIAGWVKSRKGGPRVLYSVMLGTAVKTAGTPSGMECPISTR